MKEKILIIEDDEDLRKMYEERFGKDGFETITAADGETGTALALEQRPSLILLDLMLPQRGGLNVLKILKSWPSTQSIPVVVLTNYGREEYRMEALRDGATYFLLKTDVTPMEVLARVKEIIGKKSQ
ncbi:response regulator transcription factor [Candidatus Berkelbacteria bacterium]|nr:response regulator transcription factor [Candidatus Berkelbacteria bacterium]